MAWIKRNLFFVLGSVLGLGLTGYCGWLLYAALSGNAAVSLEYKTTSDALKEMLNKSPFPNTTNIQAAKADQERVRRFLTDFKKSFSSFPAPPAKDEKGFKTYLEETLIRFRNEATNAGVLLPPDYPFAFSGLIGRLTYPSTSIGPWMQELEEIDAILAILYRAKINYLGSLQRVPVAADDTGSGDILSDTPVTNQWGVVTPYKIAFRGFSAEIAAVLEGFARSSNCFIVRAMAVGPDTSVQPMIEQPPPQQAAPGYVPRAQNFAPRPNAFGVPNNRGVPFRFRGPSPAAPAPVAAAAVAGPVVPQVVTILTENPLLVVMSIDVVKLKALEH